VVARYGGEEFAVAMPHTDAAQACIVAEKIRWAVATTPVTLIGSEPHLVTVSIGVASYPATTGDPADLIGQADSALYVAKRSGRNQVALAPEQGATLPAPVPSL